MPTPFLTKLKLREPRDGFTQNPIGPLRSTLTFTHDGEDYSAYVELDAAAYLLERYPSIYEMAAPWATVEQVIRLEQRVNALAEHLGVVFEDK